MPNPYTPATPATLAAHERWLARRAAERAHRAAERERRERERRERERDRRHDAFLVAGLCALAFAFILATVRTLAGV